MKSITTAAQSVVALKQKRDAIIKELKAQEQILLDLMDESGETRLRTDAGTITVCKGKRTVVVTDPVLKAELRLLQERGVKEGRAKERIGNRYCMVRS